MTNVLQNFRYTKILFFFSLFFLSHTAFGCDLCGCATSGGSFGQGTLNNTSFIGTRYIFQKFVSKDGIFDNSPTSTERFNTYQLWGRIPVSKKLYVSVVLPYQDLKRKFTDRNENINGLGDITLISWLKIPFYKKENTEYTQIGKQPSGHSIEIGLGSKLPTGNFEQVLSNRVNPGFQLGTGSLDGILSLTYTYAADKFGINTNTSYYIKGENKNEYRFGNQFSFAGNFFYAIPKKQYSIIPFIGISGNIYDKIKQFNEVIANTDGAVYNTTVGSEVLFKTFIFGANYTLPLQHNLFGGNVTPKQSIALYLNFNLNN
ncbi:hypothetical protein DUT90_00430 [Polaribacter sp. WD7]|uniref:hypothetical protein n=1 Tax=Polaribacter sp. WD7 TaxID=2269061 RepID=UPI000DF3C3E7|nr:hypothetical protein [Polaribacter sp. WD7]RCS28492.1 hypothetical protein DUT90_00430 [Polaribacter sp. WD7]